MNTYPVKTYTSYSSDEFWQLADMTKMSEKYKIDQDLQFLKHYPLTTLKKIFTQYRFFTQFYITDLAILVSKLPAGELRSILAEILHDELGSGNANESHPELYDNFLLSIGVGKEELNATFSSCIHHLKNIQTSLSEKSWAYGIGLRGMGGECLCQIYLTTMYDFFSQNPEIIEMKDQIAWKFWEIHIGETDLHHQQIVRNAINNLIISQPDTTVALVNGYLESVNAWDKYWKQIFNLAKTTSEFNCEGIYETISA